MKITTETWAKLHGLAVEAMQTAYAPYSGYPVGAAGIAEDGTFYSGCNIENAGYGVTLCAECGLVSAFVRGGGRRLMAVACVNGNSEPVVPCGRCRQVLYEHGGPEMLLAMPEGIMPMKEVLPYGFGQKDLEDVATSTFTRSDAKAAVAAAQGGKR
ncbi:MULTISPECIES: cytidine deaminase [unclassified Actinobaculum]|uniref:cytidine deaminase n=1 Tax=unclassified Actinobaculum TaxID=2609299 RepID=UPI000D527246|nr:MULTISPECIES: cytidine deaminase [unclassified Actinobaculum]AWE43421.1 cytidine deaminase [Actinobaculum sp. 313]RTE50972.1 cytidine deaminase [Actinobaculum sp. 352]